MASDYPSQQKGFTFLELAIVLVAIGFIIGGIVIGKDMIHTAQIRNTIGEVAKYTQSVTDFQDTYLSLPGDFANAEAYWGSDATCPNTAYTATPHQATCNGDGDGFIESAGKEWVRAWQQLANAGMIDGTYTGVPGSGSSTEAKLGVNVPLSQFNGAGYTLMYLSVAVGGDATYWSQVQHHVFFFGIPVSASYSWGAALTPSEALTIELKVDDGLPPSGTVMSLRNASNPNCNTTNVASTAKYNTTYNGVACSLIFITGL